MPRGVLNVKVFKCLNNEQNFRECLEYIKENFPRVRWSSSYSGMFINRGTELYRKVIIKFNQTPYVYLFCNDYNIVTWSDKIATEYKCSLCEWETTEQQIDITPDDLLAFLNI